MSKSITFLLLDKDERSGALKCTVRGSNVLVYRIPKEACEHYIEERELKRTGVYLLFDRYEQSVYVGQAVSRKNGQGLLNRILEPHNTLDWTEAVIFTSTDNKLGATEACFLENDFYNRALRAGTYKVTNGNEPSPGDPNEELQYEMESYVENCKTILYFLGYTVFEPPVTLKRPKKQPVVEPEATLELELEPESVRDVAVDPIPESADEPVTVQEVELDSVKGTESANEPEPAMASEPAIESEAANEPEPANEQQPELNQEPAGRITPPSGLQLHLNHKGGTAMAYMADDGFWLLKGSAISRGTNKSCPAGIAKLREQHASDLDIHGVTAVDIKFNSPSSAASFVVGGAANGNTTWRNWDGVTLGNIRKN